MGPFRTMISGTFEFVLNSFDQTLQNASYILGANASNVDSGIANAFSINGETINTAWNYVKSLATDYIEPVCMVILCICVLIELANVAMKVDMLKWEDGLKVGIKLVLAKVCMDTAPVFMEACYKQAAEWIGQIGSRSSTVGTELAASVNEIVSDTSFFGGIVMLAMASIAFIAVEVCGALVVIIAIARLFEILVYVAVAPIPCAFFPMGEGTGIGVSRITINFFKSYIAVCLQGVLMILCIRIYNIVVASAITTMGTNLADVADETAKPIVQAFNLGFIMLIGAITLIVCMTRCSGWAKSIMDTH